MWNFLYFLFTVGESDMQISKVRNQSFRKKNIQNGNLDNVIAGFCVIASSVQSFEHSSVQECLFKT